MIDNYNDLPKEIRELIKMRNKLFRNHFDKYIKSNLLIRLKEEIKSSPDFSDILQYCYDVEINPMVSFGVDDVDFDICANLAMINWYLNINNTDDIRSAKYRDTQYCNELKNRTITQCRLRKLVNSFGKNNSLLAFTPINYAMHCLTNQSINCLNKNLAKNELPDIPNAKFRINTILVMVKTLNSILTLTENNDYGNAFALLRTLIESMFIYLAVYDDETVAEKYYEFMEYRNQYEMNGEYSAEFLNIVPRNVQKHNYLNYGWLDTLDSKKKHLYTFKEVVDYSKKTDKNYDEYFLSAYKYCCKYVHGNYLNQNIDEISFIWILVRAGGILVNISRQLNYIFQASNIFNEIDLETNLINAINEADDLLKQRNSEQ